MPAAVLTLDANRTAAVPLPPGSLPPTKQQISGFDALSDRSHFIVAYPEGIEKSWADGRGNSSFR